MKRGALVVVLSLAGCFSKPSFSGRDAGAGSDTGGGEMGGGDDAMTDAMVDAMIDAPPDGPVPFQLALQKISAGGRHVCAIGNDTRLWCWGDNDRGQLGAFGMPATGNPVLASSSNPIGWTEVAAGTDHTCGIRSGTVYCWGRNDSRESRPSTTGATATMNPITLAGTPARVFAGNSISCAILTDDTAYCWGLLNLGAGGTGQMVTQLTATGSGPVNTWSTIALGDDHACAIAAGSGNDAGKLFCWGGDAHNGLGHDLPLGVHRIFGSPAETLLSGTGTRYRAVDATQYVTCAVTTGRALQCWGATAEYHTLGAVDGDLDEADITIGMQTDWEDVSIDRTFACARKMNGAVYCWGNDQDGALGQGDYEPQRIAPVIVDVNGLTSGMTALATGEAFACVLDPNTNAWCWGANRQGELGNREIATKDTASRVRLSLGPNDVINKLVAGQDFTCALVGPTMGAATAYCWGKNEQLQVDSQAGSVAEAVPKPAFPPGTSFVDIAAGEMHVCGRSPSGATVTCWGDNSEYQLGRVGGAGFSTHMMPTLLPWSAIGAGSRASCGISDGQLWCWGSVPGSMQKMAPFSFGRPPSGGPWHSISMGSGFAVGIAFDVGQMIPKLYAFGLMCESGLGASGTQMAINPLVLRRGLTTGDEYETILVAAAQHGGQHTCIHYTTANAPSTARVTCWGMNGQKQVNETDPSCAATTADQMMPVWRGPVFGTQSIATAGNHSCALAGNNSLYCWGGNDHHELADRGVSTPGIPEQVPPGNPGGWTVVATGSRHTCVVNDMRKDVYCWGENRHGQLGDGTRFQPRPIASGLVLP
jgi:alpha-tubulin suppressor-like RCC1 family protein